MIDYFLLLNFQVPNNSVCESLFDKEILKESGFGSKMKVLSNLYYSSVIIPVKDNEEFPEDLKEFQNSLILKSKNPLDKFNELVILKFLKNPEKLKNIDFTFDWKKISYNSIGISYSDGSFNKETNEASYGVCRLLEESNSGILNNFTEMITNYQEFSGIIENGTNNIGELYGIKKAIEQFSGKPVEVIISDSEYSLKCFREWIYNWKNNDFLNYSKKPIENKELIQEIFSMIENSDSEIIFKWVKGHNKDPFNEICDELAKNAVGIKK